MILQGYIKQSQAEGRYAVTLSTFDWQGASWRFQFYGSAAEIRALLADLAAQLDEREREDAGKLADHFYVPDKTPHDRRLTGVSIILLCGACGRPGSEHPRRPQQEHPYVAGTKHDPDYDHIEPPTLLCVACDRPRWEHPGPTPP